MAIFDQFFQAPAVGERVIGTYLYPTRYFGTQKPDDRDAATEIIGVVHIGSHEVLVTRSSGLFIRPPASFRDPLKGSAIDSEKDFRGKLAFEEEAAEAFNQLICELTLKGIVSEPASPVHISRGQIIDGHALITSTSGGREIYLERTMAPSLALMRHEWLMGPSHAESVLEQAATLSCTKHSVSISSTLPSLVAGAYYWLSRRQPSEALIDSWIVTEQALDYLWKEYIETLSDDERKKRLKDERTYTAAVRAEILLTAGRVEEQLYKRIQRARGFRNDLAHRARISLQNTVDCVLAMKAVIELICGEVVAEPSVSQGVNW